MTSMKGKAVIVTGARSGIGQATARKFLEEGAHVALADVQKQEEEVNQLKEQGHHAIAIQCDVSKEEEVERMVAETVEAFGQLDMAYNNAGVQSPIMDTMELTEEEYNRVMDTNLRGIWLCMKHELRQMNHQETGGAIVNCSSLGGLVGIAGRSAYHASKHGVLGFTKSSALEYASKGIRINAVCPGIIETPMVEGMLNTEKGAMDELIKSIPAGRLAKPEEVASVAVWLCSDDASYIIGQGISVDGGYTVQ